MKVEETRAQYLFNPATSEKTAHPEPIASDKAFKNISRHDFFVGCALIGFLSRTDETLDVQAADAIEQADEVLKQLEERESSH